MFAVLIAPPITVWLISLVHWLIQGDIDGISWFLGMTAGAMLGVLTIKPPVAVISPICCGLAWVIVLAYTLVRNMVERAQLVAIQLDVLQGAVEQLRERPDNIGTKLKIAKLVYDRGLTSSAIAVAESALKNVPAGPFDAEMKMLTDWKQTAGNPSVFRSLPCLECGHLNPAGDVDCSRCKAPVLLHYAQGKWVGPNLLRRVVFGFIGVLVPVLGIPMALVYLEGWRLAVVYGGILVASLGLVFSAIRPEPRRRLT